MIRFGTTLAILLSVTTAAADISESTEVLPTARIFRGATLTNAADSGRVFLGAGAKIILFEVISHDSLVEVIELQLPVLVKALYLSDELLIALDLVSGIYFYDVSSFYSPQLISSLNLGLHSYDVEVQDSILWISHLSNGTSRVDFSSINSPVVTADSPLPSKQTSYHNGFLYARYADSMRVLNAESLVHLSSLGYPYGIEDSYSEVIDFTFTADYGVLLRNSYFPYVSSSVRIFDMATPLSPQVVTYWGYDTALTGIVIDSDTAFISTENALHIVRIDSSAATEELGMTYLSNGTVKSYSSPFLFNCKGYWPGLAVFEMMPDYNFVQGADIGTSARSASVYANDSVLLVGRFNDGGGFYLVNISDIENPVISEHYTENLGSVRDLKLQDDIAFIASSNALKLYQIRGVDGLEYLSQVELGTRLDVLTVADM